jgi:putative transcriptional regulator
MIRILLSTRLGERRWTQAHLARKTGIRAATINELYNEFAERISLEHLDLICEALDCDLSDLITVCRTICQNVCIVWEGLCEYPLQGSELLCGVLHKLLAASLLNAKNANSMCAYNLLWTINKYYLRD